MDVPSILPALAGGTLIGLAPAALLLLAGRIAGISGIVNRPMRHRTTVGEQKASNVQLNACTTETEFVAFRTGRDGELAAPVLILPSVQVNVRAGALPEAEADGFRYLEIPLDHLGVRRP